MSNRKRPLVIIRRSRRNSLPRRAGSWKIAYADFMTAMMAFFLVMWVLSLIPREELKTIAEYFRMPLTEAIRGGLNTDHARSVIPGGNPSVIPQNYQRDRERLQELRQELDQLIESDPVLNEFRPQLLIDMTHEGLRIQIVDQKNRPMFAMGSAQVQPYMREILRSLSKPLNKLPNRLLIAGHTDAHQYLRGEREYSNWELSSDRANAARRELVAGGLAENKVKQISGLASTVDLVKEDPQAAVNRRISIVALSRQAEEQMDAQRERN
ncbi:MAG TPA: flagellar motor protein MotB [Paenalcaligenes sp.]|nr:flagellar motor protein MotB [Paenalcaligenes sp.]